MPFRNRVTDLLGVDIPVVQAPMGWIARSALAAAVSEAGAMGIIETSSGEVDAVVGEIRRMRELTDRPFGINLAQAFLAGGEVVDRVLGAAVDAGVRFVTTSAGSPTRYTDRLHDAGMTVFHVVPTLTAALKAVDAGVDGLVVEGGEGGGFKSPTPVATMVLVPLVRSRVDVPIIAAGGICDGPSMAAALALGAEGVQMGTRMVAAAESPVHHGWKDAVIAASDTGTVFLNRRHSPALRALRTPYTEELDLDEGNVMARFGDVGAVYFEGRLDRGVALSGQVAGRIDAVEPVAEIIGATARDCLRVLADLADRYPPDPDGR